MDHSGKKTRILLIAPYPGLIKLFEERVSNRDDMSLTCYESDTDEAAILIQSLPVEDFDIIISRGYTCNLIEDACGRHIMDVGISVYDVLRAIRLAQNYNGRFAVVGFRSIIDHAFVLKDVLLSDYGIFPVSATNEIENELLRLKDTGYTMIVGDVITTNTARRIGLQTILITTSSESVDAVLESSASLYKEKEKLLAERNFYKDLLSNASSGIAVFDENGHLQFSNLAEDKALRSCLMRSVQALLRDRQLQFVRTIGEARYIIDGKVIQCQTSRMAAFYFRRMYKNRKCPGLLSFFGTEDGPRVSQRIFYTLSPVLKAALEKINTFRFFSRPVMITGPEGSGKDSFAFLMHQNSSYHNRPMAIIDCRFALDKAWKDLLNNEESPVFSNGLTLFFKDCHVLNSHQQAELLLTIVETELDQRNQLIFSYAPNISPEFENGRLKNEILHVRNALSVHIPPLNERREDIPNLATLYLSEFNSQMAKQAIAFEPEALTLLQNFNWTENLYQLRHVVQTLLLRSESAYITAKETEALLNEQKDSSETNDFSPISLEGSLEEITKRVIRQVLREENMNQSKAAKRLRIGRTTLRRHM